jgi:uncharacterized protein YggE
MDVDYLETIGSGTASAPPDHALLTLGLEAAADRVAAAMDTASAAVSAVIERLRAEEIDDSDVQTQSVRVEEHWDHQAGRPDGYVVRQALTVLVRDVDAVAGLLADCVDAGGDALRIHGLDWGVGPDAGLAEAAREAAWRDALDQAEQLAALAGRRLGPLSRIRDGATDGAVPLARFAATASGGMPVATGETTVTVTLRVRWQLA